MKRLVVVLLLALTLTVPSVVQAVWLDWTPSLTLLNAVTSTGAGTAVDIGFVTSKFTCCVTWSGTTPTNTVVAFEGSINNSTFAAWATPTITATGTCWHVVDKPAKYIRGNYVSKSGGDATTAVTLFCVCGGN